jgi:hypothetical protein
MGVVEVDCYIMAPHEWFAWLCNDYPDEFGQLFADRPLDEFWQHVKRFQNITSPPPPPRTHRSITYAGPQAHWIS